MGTNRWLSVCGIIFAPLLVIGLIVASGPSDVNNDSQLTSFYADSANRLISVVGLYVLLAAAFCFVGFLLRLHGELRAESSAGNQLPTAILGTGMITVVCILVGAICFADVPGGAIFGSISLPGVDVERWFIQLGDGIILLPGMLAAALMIVLTSAHSLRRGPFPSWFCWLGFLVGVLLVLSPLFFPAVALPVWTLIASILLYRARPLAA